MPSPHGSVSSDALVELLAPALGREQSETLVEEAKARLGIDSPDLSHNEAIQILDDLTKTSGVVGVAARFAKVRVARWRRLSSMPPASSSRGSFDKLGAVSEKDRFSLEAVTMLMAPALGDEAAQEAVRDAASRLALQDRLTEQQVVWLFDALVAVPGVVGTVARLAKSRFLMRRLV